MTCRKLTGGPFVAFTMVPEESLKTNIDPPKITHGTHEVGMPMHFHGCDNCPATLYKTADGFPGTKIVFSGTLDGKENIETEGKPQMELWVKYRVPWLSEIEGCMQFDEFPPKQEA